MSPENRKPDDRELESFLSGEHAVSREYRRLDAPAAPAALDDAVLRLAREAVALPRPLPPALRWRLPLALAATMLLSLGTLRLMQADPAVQNAMELRDAAPQAVAAPAPAPVPVRREPAPQAAPKAVAPALPPAPRMDAPAAPQASVDASVVPPLAAAARTAEAVEQAAIAERQAVASAQRVEHDAPPPGRAAKSRAFMYASPPESAAPVPDRERGAAPDGTVAMDQPAMAQAAAAAADPDLPACPLPEDCAGQAAQACFACVRRLRDDGRVEAARELLRQVRSRAQARGDHGYAVPPDLQALEATP